MKMESQVIKKEEETYQAAFQSLQERTASISPGWIQRLRESAMDRFDQLGFPSVKEEDWKYTNVAPISRIRFDPITSSLPEPTGSLTANEVSLFGYVEAGTSQLVFENGVLRKELSSLSGLAGVIAIDLAQAIDDEQHGELIRKHLARGADHNVNGFTAMNTAMFPSGAFVLIPKGAVIESPLHLLFIANPAQSPVATFPRVLILAEENSQATIIETYVGLKESEYLTTAVVEVVLEDGARLEHYKVQRESVEAFHIATTSAELGSNSSYDTTTINFGAQLCRHDVKVVMAHEGAECWVDGLYVTGDGQHTDTHSVIDHQKPHCTSHQLYKGILDGKSRAVFNGKVFVRHDAQKTDAMQTNKNLLLSNEARVDTKPQLEILADDVKCAHGAAVGQIDADELFYLETRGIHHDLAKNLLTYGFAEEVIGKIKVESIRAQLDEAVLNRIQARLEVP